MKKVLATAAVASLIAAAASTQAATVYTKDNFTYKLSADWQIQLRQDQGIDQELDVEFDDLELKNYAAYTINDSLTAFGQLDFGGKKAADEGKEFMHLEEAYLGLSISNIKLMMGKTTSAGDAFGVLASKETYVADDAFDEAGHTSGDDLFKVTADLGKISLIAAYEIEASSEKSAGPSFFDVYASVDLKPVTIGFAYQSSDDQEDIYGVSVSADAGPINVHADYSVCSDVLMIYNIGVTLPVSTMEISAGYTALDYDDDAEEDITGYYANVVHAFPNAKNVSIFGEIGDNDQDDMGFLVGMRLKF